MLKQLDIPFPQYSIDMDKAKVFMLLAENESLKKIIAQKDRSISAYKGHFKKQKSKSKKSMAKPIQQLNQFLLDELMAFKRKHEGLSPDYILMTLKNFTIVHRQVYSSQGPHLFRCEDDGENFSLKFRGIPVLPVQEGLKEDTIKLVIT